MNGDGVGSLLRLGANDGHAITLRHLVCWSLMNVCRWPSRLVKRRHHALLRHIRYVTLLSATLAIRELSSRYYGMADGRITGQEWHLRRRDYTGHWLLSAPVVG